MKQQSDNDESDASNDEIEILMSHIMKRYNDNDESDASNDETEIKMRKLKRGPCLSATPVCVHKFLHFVTK